MAARKVNAFVTGSARGTGLAIGERLAQDGFSPSCDLDVAVEADAFAAHFSSQRLKQIGGEPSDFAGGDGSP